MTRQEVYQLLELKKQYYPMELRSNTNEECAMWYCVLKDVPMLSARKALTTYYTMGEGLGSTEPKHRNSPSAYDVRDIYNEYYKPIERRTKR